MHLHLRMFTHILSGIHVPQVCTSKMNLSDEVDLEDYVSRPDKISAAEISAICQEAGMLAVRKNRYVGGAEFYEEQGSTKPLNCAVDLKHACAHARPAGSPLAACWSRAILPVRLVAPSPVPAATPPRCRAPPPPHRQVRHPAQGL